MSIKGLDAFYGAQDALLEQAIYDGVAAGTVRNADDLDRLTREIDGQFSQFPALTPELRTRWATVSLMYEDPLYDVNYVYGGPAGAAVLRSLHHPARVVCAALHRTAQEWVQPTARGTTQAVPGHRSFRAGALERRPRVVKSSTGSIGGQPTGK